MKVSAEFSHKMTVLSILAMIAVVFIHSTAYMTLPSPAKWNVFAETIITRSFSRWAVPFFFAVSGFWFGRSAFIRGEMSAGAFLLKKSRSLLVPYLCWCVLGFLVALPLILGNNFLGHKGLWERTIVAIPGIWPKIDAFFGLTNVGPQSNMPLWYVRSLLVIFLLAPVWRFILQRTFGKAVLLTAAFVGLFVHSFGIPLVMVPSFGVWWFAIGLVCAQFKVEEWRVPNWLWIGSMVPYVVGSVVVSLLVAGYLETPGKDLLLGRCEGGVIPLFGIIVFWGLYDRILSLQTCAIPWCVRQTFFIYCLHEIICSYQMSLARFVFGKTDCVTFVSTLVVPWLSFAFCAAAAWTVHRLSPRTYGVICGGR